MKRQLGEEGNEEGREGVKDAEEAWSGGNK